MDSKFVDKTLLLRGKDEGQRWLDSIPDLVKEFEDKWEIKVGEPFLNLSVNYVAPVLRKDGTKAVLKIGYVKDSEFRSEVEALYVFNGEGVVKALEIDLDKGVVLLESLEPGSPLSELEDDEEATRILAGVMKKIWKEEPGSYQFRKVNDWFKELEWYWKIWIEQKKLFLLILLKKLNKILRN